MGLKERRARERELRKEMILDAARQLLFEKGMEAASINQIAKKAELGVGTIYFYFKSKEEIFVTLQEEGLKIIHAEISSIRGTGADPEKKLRETALAYLRFSEKHKNYFDIISHFLSTPQVVFAPSMKNQIDQHGSKIIELIIEMMEEGESSGRFKAGDAENSALTFWGSLHGLIQLKKMRDTMLRGRSHQELFEYAVAHLIRGLK